MSSAKMMELRATRSGLLVGELPVCGSFDHMFGSLGSESVICLGDAGHKGDCPKPPSPDVRDFFDVHHALGDAVYVGQVGHLHDSESPLVSALEQDQLIINARNAIEGVPRREGLLSRDESVGRDLVVASVPVGDRAEHLASVTAAATEGQDREGER